MTLPHSFDLARLGELARRYGQVRSHSVVLSAPLSAEDQCIQSMPDASPTKWHLAHTSWFFETLVLSPLMVGYSVFDARYGQLFNSYYESLGKRHPRDQRGLLTRPSLDEVARYRAHVDEHMQRFIAGPELSAAAAGLIELGLAHEEQHQELILTDILHALSRNPLEGAYRTAPHAWTGTQDRSPTSWISHPGGEVGIGHDGLGFAFDNETPAHRVLLRPFDMASKPVDCGEYLAFIEDGGYARPEFWLSDGWALVQSQGWTAPLYWRHEQGEWSVFTLQGRRPIDLGEPVCHLGFHEAAAYACWARARLPTEFEWEAWTRQVGYQRQADLRQGRVWEWTRSSYDPYPGFKPWTGVAAEYNGKFMASQVVLRGGSLASPPGHVRPTYRNFFPPSARWQFSGLRLARDT